MKLTMNFKMGQPSLNGRIYTEIDFIPALKTYLLRGDTAFVTYGYKHGNMGSLDLKKIIGIATGYEILTDGTVRVDIRWLDVPEYNDNKDKFNEDSELSSNCLGTIGEDNIVDIEAMVYLFVVKDDEKEGEEDGLPSST